MPFPIYEKSRILAEFIRNGRSPILTQRWVRRVLRKKAPTASSLRLWDKKFAETGNLAHRPRSGRPPTPTETVNRVRNLFKENPQVSLRKAATQLNIPLSTAAKIMKKRTS